jgi:membrane protease YdiL (CAAX protease family)
MLMWTLILLVLVILLFFSQLGILFPLQLQFTIMSSIILYVLTLACLVIVLLRILTKIKKGERENLLKRIKELEQELIGLRGKLK